MICFAFTLSYRALSFIKRVIPKLFLIPYKINKYDVNNEINDDDT